MHPNDSTTAGGQPAGDSLPGDESWTFRGYQMHATEFNTAMIHLYRGEVTRANTWRSRLDTTTNWAIITTATAITFALSDPAHHHGVILVTLVLACLFLFIEARRDCYFELWSYRIRLLETDFFAAMLVPPFRPSPDWAETLASSLLRPKFPISIWEALGRRLRRSYFAIFAVLILVWLFKNYTQPTEVGGWEGFIDHARLGPIPGEITLALVAIFAVSMLLFAALTTSLQNASGEVLTHYKVFERLQRKQAPPPSAAPSGKGRQAERSGWWPGRRVHRGQVLTFIMSDHGAAVAAKIRQEMQRGVTALHGEGIQSPLGTEVLLCALTETEIPALKRVIRGVDPAAFVAVMPASEIEGSGFAPL